ncbi:MAG: hypothetical protein EXS12_06405 [Phycisphaerales bacterium]|nr:hypothetical protein [Phycisphaerales bacterium]
MKNEIPITPSLAGLMRAIALLPMVIVASSCNFLVPAAYMIDGPPSIDAQYTLPDQKTVVFVDDRTNILSRTQLRAVIGDKVATDLMKKGLVTETIASRDALSIARKDETIEKPMPISEIGQRVGAETIIYVQIREFALSEPGGLARPSALASVKVIDVTGRSRLYPPASELTGQLVTTNMREVENDLYQSTSGRRQIEDTLAAEIGAEVAKLFYKHETTELGKNLGVRK